MTLLLKAFVDQFNRLGTITWEDPDRSRKITSNIHAVACAVDAPATAMVLNRKQYNGYDGCPWCYHPGQYIAGTVRYPYRENIRLRTHKEVVRDMKKATRFDTVVNGIKGLSAVVQLEAMDLVHGIVPDYMHCVLEGVAKQFTEFWLTECASDAYIGGNVDRVNARLSQIRPPVSSTRLPRSLAERALWKATEWKFWLLFYSLPCVDGILPNRFVCHFSLLCQAIFMLLKTTVSREDLSCAGTLLTQFVRQTECLYGKAMSTYNLHQLLHLCDSVRNLGPLWATSLFPFESQIGDILQLVSAAKALPLQIAERCVMKQKLQDFCHYVSLPDHLSIFSHTHKRSHGVLGHQQTPLGISPGVEELIRQRLGYLPQFERYLRACVNGSVIHSVQHGRPRKTCSRFIRTKWHSFCEVLLILRVKQKQDIVFLCKEAITSPVTFGATHIVECQLPPEGQNVHVIADCEVECTAIFIDVGTSLYLSASPNNNESD